jgi:hypothetical protein
VSVEQYHVYELDLVDGEVPVAVCKNCDKKIWGWDAIFAELNRLELELWQSPVGPPPWKKAED